MVDWTTGPSLFKAADVMKKRDVVRRQEVVGSRVGPGPQFQADNHGRGVNMRLKLIPGVGSRGVMSGEMGFEPWK